MQALGKTAAGIETRLTRFAIVHGAMAEAKAHLEKALTLLLAMSQPPNETMAWCR
jgi:hypothetical protein